MRSYTNSNSVLVEVSDEHLDSAIKIKLELQGMSPRMRTNWKKHKEMMIEDGFYDSDTNEPYRCMIKSEQEKRGILPTAEKRSNMVAENTLDSIKSAVGEMAWQNREIQNSARKLGSIKRNIMDKGLFIDEVKMEIRNSISTVEFDKIINHTFSPILQAERTNSRLIAVITDWHIGAIVDIEGNKYNYEIAKERINSYLSQLYTRAIEEGIYRIDVIFMGDAVEHAYMRSSQAYYAEFPLSTQMVKCASLINALLSELSNHFFVSYSGFAGNHDRMNGADKNGNIDGDDAMVVVNEYVKQFIELSKKENLVYTQASKYSYSMQNVNGVNILFEHGDMLKKNDTGKLADRSLRDGITYDVIVYGHFHHFAVTEVGVNKFEIRFGSIKGSDDYSEKLGLGSAPSQGIIVIRENGDVKPERIMV